MACQPDVLKSVPLFSLLDDDETAVLAGQVEIKSFAPRERVYKKGEPGGQAYIMVSGKVRITTVDEDQQEVIVDEPSKGEFFGFASMLEQTVHQTTAIALEETACIEVSRKDILVLLKRKPHSGMDLLTTLSRQFHAAQQIIRMRATRNPNEIIERKSTFGERIADEVAGFGGSWTFIVIFMVATVFYVTTNIVLRGRALGSLSFHSPQSLSFHAGGRSSAGHHDEPESTGYEGPAAQRTGLRREPPSRVGDSGPGAQTEPPGRKDR
jgi:CRP/FNR family cyclic AMP-dependent transcriptional regulator